MGKKLTFEETKVSDGLGLSPDEKKQLPPPEIVGSLYDYGKWICLDIRDHLGRSWTLAAKHWRSLRRKLRYFRSLPQETIDAVFLDERGKLTPIIQWPRMRGWACVCGGTARQDPRKQEEWCCSDCGNRGPAESSQFVSTAKKAAPVTADKPIPAKTGKTSQPREEVAPKPSMTLKERLEARRAKQG